MTKPKDHSVEDAVEFHRRMILQNWSDEPDLMYYSSLHLPEFFPHAIIHRSGPVSALTYALRDDVARTVTRSPLGPPLVMGFTIGDEERTDLIVFLESLTDQAFLSNVEHQNPFR